MTSFATAVGELDWKKIAHQLNAEGYAELPGLLASASEQTLADQMTPAQPCVVSHSLPAILGVAIWMFSKAAYLNPSQVRAWRSTNTWLQ